MKDMLQKDLLPKFKPKNLMQDENIVFHHQNQTTLISQEDDDLQRQKELEAYRQKFEEAMIRIEDEEDVEAYKDQKAELDDEFKELEGDQELPEPFEKINLDDEAIDVREVEETTKVQSKMDTRNASGAARDLKRNEMIDWQSSDALNTATKMAIRFFEREFTFEQFLKEKEEKEGVKCQDQESGDELDDQEAEEDLGIPGWDRQWAERMFLETQAELKGGLH